jgi:arsenite methyltransferase
MPDAYANTANLDSPTLARLVEAMEISARDPQHRRMVASYLAELMLQPGARVLEIGCGTGAIARMIASHPHVAEVVGVDPSPHFLTRARELAAGVGKLTFEQGGGHDLPVPSDTFDAVVVHRVLSHVVGAPQVLAEAFRALRPGGGLAVFDGDYATITVAIGEHDPLETCVRAVAPSYITDPFVVRRLSGMARATGFTQASFHSFGYAQIEAPDYMLSLLDRGADALMAAGRIGRELADALKAEGRRRVAAHTFFGHVAYASLVARKPD